MHAIKRVLAPNSVIKTPSEKYSKNYGQKRTRLPTTAYKQLRMHAHQGDYKLQNLMFMKLNRIHIFVSDTNWNYTT